jgi:PAS domain S-box-containing protein
MTISNAQTSSDSSIELLMSLPIAAVLVSIEGVLLAATPRWFVNSGRRAEDTIGRPVRELFIDAQERFTWIRAQLDAGRNEVASTVTYVNPDGRVQRFLSEVSYWPEPGPRAVGVLAIDYDLSEVAAAEQAQQDADAMLRTVVDNMPAMLSVQDAATMEYLLVNAPALAVLRRTADEVIGKRPHEIFTEEERAHFWREMSQPPQTGRLEIAERCIEEGEFAGHAVRFKRMIFHDHLGHARFVTIAEDISSIKAAERALAAAAAEAQAANRAKSEFLTNMSHEIRTPLNGVLGVAGALARTPLTGSQKEMVSIIETSARTLETLLSDILDLARVEAGKMELRPEPFDLADSVTACGALFDAAAQAKGLDLEVAIAPEALGAYVGDATRIRQILCNLLGNAVKFTTAGRVALSARAIHGEARSELRFEVADTGIGFDAETKARLFSRFEQADGSITRRFGGSGLGLAISRALAEAMGGRLEADSAPGRGSTFALVLQLPRCGDAPVPSPAEPGGSAEGEAASGLRVLLAEDHPTNRRVVELILGAAGVDLSCVENGADALAACARAEFDLVLMDMQMPVMDGLSAVRRLREREAELGLGRTPIYVLTGNAMPEHVSASLDAGADGHISKPIVAHDLLQLVATVAAPAPAAGLAATEL